MQLALPAFFVALALALSTSQTATGPRPDLPLGTDMFGQPVVSFYEQVRSGPQALEQWYVYVKSWVGSEVHLYLSRMGRYGATST